MPSPAISEYNRTWGICGFTSALTHLYESDIRLKGKIDNGRSNEIRLGLLIEVVTFLKYVTAFHNELIADLNKLNIDLKSPSMAGGVGAFIILAENAVRNQQYIGVSNDYQCAMTPKALELYVQKICGIPAAKLTEWPETADGEGILGLMDEHNELKHWVFRDSKGYIYNWGHVIAPGRWEDHPMGMGHAALAKVHVGCHVSVR